MYVLIHIFLSGQPRGLWENAYRRYLLTLLEAIGFDCLFVWFRLPFWFGDFDCRFVHFDCIFGPGYCEKLLQCVDGGAPQQLPALSLTLKLDDNLKVFVNCQKILNRAPAPPEQEHI